LKNFCQASGFVPDFQYTSTSQGYKQVKGLGEVETFQLRPVNTKPHAVSSLRRVISLPEIHDMFAAHRGELKPEHGHEAFIQARRKFLNLHSQSLTKLSSFVQDLSKAGGTHATSAADLQALNNLGELGPATKKWITSGKLKVRAWTGDFSSRLETLFLASERRKPGYANTQCLALLLHMVAMVLQWRFTLSVHASNLAQAALPGAEAVRLDEKVWSKVRLVLEVHLVGNVACSTLVVALLLLGTIPCASFFLLVLKLVAFSVIVGVNMPLPTVFDESMTVSSVRQHACTCLCLMLHVVSFGRAGSAHSFAAA
jgi:hypothetical protein